VHGLWVLLGELKCRDNLLDPDDIEQPAELELVRVSYATCKLAGIACKMEVWIAGDNESNQDRT
jgi:hypothetical protein